MPQPPVKAWIYDVEEGVEAVFARSEAGARGLVARVTGCSWEEAGVVRWPSLDGKATTTGAWILPPAAFFYAGFRVFCAHCEHRISDNGECWKCEDNGVAGQVPFAEGRLAFCGQRCLEAFRAEQERIRRKKALALREFFRRVPFAAATDVTLGRPGECRCTEMGCDNVMVHFAVPGGAVTQETRPGCHYHNVYCHGCGTVLVARGDLEAFRAQRLMSKGDS